MGALGKATAILALVAACRTTEGRGAAQAPKPNTEIDATTADLPDAAAPDAAGAAGGATTQEPPDDPGLRVTFVPGFCRPSPTCRQVTYLLTREGTLWMGEKHVPVGTGEAASLITFAKQFLEAPHKCRPLHPDERSLRIELVAPSGKMISAVGGQSDGCPAKFYEIARRIRSLASL